MNENYEEEARELQPSPSGAAAASSAAAEDRPQTGDDAVVELSQQLRTALDIRAGQLERDNAFRGWRASDATDEREGKRDKDSKDNY